MKDYFLNLLPERSHKCNKLADFICERCGNGFQLPFWHIKKGRRFCSHECRKQDPLKTLLSRVDKQENGCWNYTGTIGWGGYGQIKVGKTSYLAHRLMWIVWNKKLVPDGHVVRHTCIGNPRCINPDHLITGTQKENVQDCIRQGRFAKNRYGEQNSLSVLTDDVVREIRKLRGPDGFGSEGRCTYRSLAGRFGVSYHCIWQVVNRETWNHVV